MPIPVQCTCGRAVRVKDELSGKTIKCPDCGIALAVAGPSTFTVAPEPASPRPSVPPPPRRTEDRPRRRRHRPDKARPGRWLWVVGGVGALVMAVCATLMIIKSRPGKPAKPVAVAPNKIVDEPEVKPLVAPPALKPVVAATPPAPVAKPAPEKPKDPPAKPPDPKPPDPKPPEVKPTPPPPKPPPPDPKPPVPAKDALRVVLSKFGRARVSAGNLANKSLAGVLLDFEARVARHAVLFEAPTVTALDAKGNEVGASVVFIASGRENLGPQARILANTVCKRLDVAIGAQQFEAPATGSYGRTVAEASSFKELTGKTQLTPPGVKPSIPDVMAVLPMTSGGIEYTFLQNRKVRLGFIFPAKVEQLKRLTVLGQAVALEAAKQDKAVPRVLAAAGGPRRVMRPADFQPGPGGKVYEVYHYSAFGTFGTPSRNVKIFEQADGTRKTTLLGRGSVAGFARTGFNEVTTDVDVLGSKGVFIVVNRKLGYTTAAGLRFEHNVAMDLDYDGTVVVNKINVKAKDSAGEKYISRRLLIRGWPKIVMTKVAPVGGK